MTAKWSHKGFPWPARHVLPSADSDWALLANTAASAGAQQGSHGHEGPPCALTTVPPCLSLPHTAQLQHGGHRGSRPRSARSLALAELRCQGHTPPGTEPRCPSHMARVTLLHNWPGLAPMEELKGICLALSLGSHTLGDAVHQVTRMRHQPVARSWDQDRQPTALVSPWEGARQPWWSPQATAGLAGLAALSGGPTSKPPQQGLDPRPALQ